MKKIVLLLIFITSMIHAQEMNFQIKWGDEISGNINENIPKSLCAEGIYFNSDKQLTFYFFKRVDINLPIQLSSYTITITDSIALTNEELLFLQNTSISEQKTSVKLFGSGKSSKVLDVYIAPYFKSKNTYYKIKNFTVSLVTSTTSTFKSIGVNNSVLQEGKWYKFRVGNTGIYKLSYEAIKNIGFASPENIRLYGNGGAMLSKYNADTRKPDLQEIPIYINKGADNVFNNGDFILFYLEGPVTWRHTETDEMYFQSIHQYSRYAHYFLTDSKGKASTIPPKNVTGDANYTTSSNDFYSYFEKENINLKNSGRLFLSMELDPSVNFDTTFSVPNRILTEAVKVKTSYVGRSQSSTRLKVFANNTLVEDLVAGSVNYGNSENYYALNVTGIESFIDNNENITIETQYSQSAIENEGWLDYITLNGRKKLVLDNSFTIFSDIQSLNKGIAQFNLSNANEQTLVWNITDINNVHSLPTTKSGSSLTFKDHTDSLNYYIAFNTNTAFPSPTIKANNKDIGWVPNQNLHGIDNCELLIVTHPDFLHQAEELATIHRTKDKLSVCVVTTLQVYNEYSSGKPDVSAIRDFARELYNESNNFKYLLLFGDGSVNNLAESKYNPNFIPTYESKESLYMRSTYTTDDFFGFLDDNEGESSGVIDIGIGRIPIGDTLEGRIVLNKIYSYYKSLVNAKWHSNITFIGDDEDSNTHMRDADFIADIVEDKKPEFTIEKIYLDAYEQVSTSSGSRYPDVNEAIDRALLKGQFIVNYSGHGGIRGLAHERVINLEQIRNWNNRDRYPIFVTATCELSAFDHIDPKLKKIEKTAGEDIFLKENGGAIAMLTTTRLVYSNSNKTLNTYFYQNIFNRNDEGNYYRLGDVIKETKKDFVSINTLKFALLGDPALPLACAQHNIITDSINNFPVNTDSVFVADTVNSLEKVIINGHVEDINASVINDYNGIIYVTVYDQARNVVTRSNDGITPFNYTVQNDLLFSGKARVNNGLFNIEFLTPKDMNVSYGKGKITYFATDSVTSASGQYSNFYVGGISPNTTIDEVGPNINLSINDSLFEEGGLTNQNPYLLANISDESGINVSTYGIGHDIIAYLDADPTNLYLLNDYYEADINDYTKGSLRFPLQNIENGYHTLTVRAWDVYNNVNEATIGFMVNSNDTLVVENLYNYPNPFSDYTYFVFDHNFAEEELLVTIDIFDLSGKLIYQINKNVISNGFTTSPILWNSSSAGNPAAGVYVYRAEIRSKKSNNSIVVHNKIIKTR